jgi:hypothetical protein
MSRVTDMRQTKKPAATDGAGQVSNEYNAGSSIAFPE